MKTGLIFSLLLIFLLQGCRNTSTVEVKTYWDRNQNKIKELYTVLKHNPKIKHGNYVAYYADGKIEYQKQYANNQLTDTLWHYNPANVVVEKCFYKSNMLQGKRYLFFDDGKLMATETYVNNIYNGDYEAYYENGKLKEKGKYADGKLFGTWHYYYENGTLKEIVMYKNGMENGPYQGFYTNGKLKLVGYYVDEKEDSTWITFYENDVPMEIARYKNGKEEGLTQLFTKDSTLVKEFIYHEGLPIEVHDLITGKTKTHHYSIFDEPIKKQ